MPKREKPLLNGAVFRVNVAVCFFFVASGFVTHWAYGARSLSSRQDVAQFYVRRLGRVLFTFWVAMALAVAALAALGENWGNPWYLVRCAFFLEQWVNWCPNGPSWFVFALLPSWLLYPLTRRLVVAVEEGSAFRGLWRLLLALYAASFGPAVLLCIIQRGNITMQQHANMSFWPPAQLADFAIGVTTAAMARHQLRRQSDGLEALVPTETPSSSDDGDPSSMMSSGPGVATLGNWLLSPRFLADGCVLFVLAVVLFLPRPATTFALHLNGWEPLLDHGLALAIAGFLYGSAVCEASDQGLAARLLGHRALAALGAESFEVYIFQRPLHDVFRLALDTGSSQTFVAFVLCLWLLAGLYAHYVQGPLDRWVRVASSGWEAGDVHGTTVSAGVSGR